MIFKDRDPEETVKKFKETLKNLNITFKEKVREVCEGIWCAELESEDFGWATQGKGTSEILCLASGYGEAIERLQNLFAPVIISKLENTPYAFKYYPDEKLLPLSDIWTDSIIADYIKCFELDNPWDIVTDDMISHYKENHFSDTQLCIPFYSFKENKNKYLPIEAIRSFQGSNGLASGNTYKEALVEGISEIIERWAEDALFRGNLTPPVIPRDFLEKNYKDNYDRLVSLEQKCNVEITVFDCSLNKGFPVVITLLVDKVNKLYKRSVGCHPLFEVALDRCLTESVQCNPIWDKYCKQGLMTMFNKENQDSWNSCSQYSQRTNRHTGSIPNFFFYETPSWEFKPWKSFNSFSNEKGLDYLIDLCLNNFSDVYVRNNGFLGIPAITIYIPEISMLTMPKNTKKLGYQRLFELYTGIWNNVKPLTSSIRKRILGLLESRGDLDVALPYNLPREVMLAALYIEDGQLERAINLLRLMPDERWKCAADYLELNESRNNKVNILKYFYDENIVHLTDELWSNNTPSTSFFSLTERYYRVPNTDRNLLSEIRPYIKSLPQDNLREIINNESS